MFVQIISDIFKKNSIDVDDIVSSCLQITNRILLYVPLGMARHHSTYMQSNPPCLPPTDKA